MENGKGAGVWNTRPTRRRSTSFCMDFISCPSNKIFPDTNAPLSSVSNPFIHRSSVVFPHPDGPITAVIRWAGMSKDKSDSTSLPS